MGDDKAALEQLDATFKKGWEKAIQDHSAELALGLRGHAWIEERVKKSAATAMRVLHNAGRDADAQALRDTVLSLYKDFEPPAEEPADEAPAEGESGGDGD